MTLNLIDGIQETIPMASTHRISRGAAAAAFALLAATCISNDAQAQVQYFRQVPTPDEVQAALGWTRVPARTTPKPGPAYKTRGVEWNVDEPAAAAPAAEAIADRSPAPASAPALAFNVNFDVGMSHVSRSSLAYIEAMAHALARTPGMRLAVEGHTDAAGVPRANLMLSWERAFAVFRVLVDKYGIDPARLQPIGKGVTEPMVPDDPLNAMNRRVQFRLLS